MIDGRRVLALIPARGGSKGIPGKNIIDLCGKPLIAYSIQAGLDSAYVDDVVVSTDSEEIASVAKEYGASVPFIRPDELASDTAKSIDVILHAVEWLKDNGQTYDIFILLQPTAPLRTSADIDAAMEKFVAEGMQGLISVAKVSESPVLMRTIASDGRLERIVAANDNLRRQEMPEYYVMDGSIYIIRIDELNKNTNFGDSPIPYVMPPERSVDIDEYEDLERARQKLEARDR